MSEKAIRCRRGAVLAALLMVVGGCASPVEPVDDGAGRPNILLAIADDWGWPDAGAYGAPVVQTPEFDRIAREGLLVRNAFVSSPSCTPSRGALLTGQYHWRLEGAGNLWSVFPDRFKTYPEWLVEAGYQVGVTGKGWGPGRTETPDRQLAGPQHESFQAFLSTRDAERPFAFWLGTSDPHRPFELGSGEASGMDLTQIDLPASFPDDVTTRGDVADYLWEVQRFDALVGEALRALEQSGDLDNTLVVMTGDHGMPFPRAKSNLYDSGTHVPLAIRWPGGGWLPAEIEDFVSLVDLAPTFLEVAGVAVPAEISGRSLVPLASLGSGRGAVPSGERDSVIFGKERHVPAQEAPDMGGYPSRAIRTHEYLYIRNFRPERWPNGTPNFEDAAVPGNWFADTDNGPTKSYMVDNRDRDAEHRRLYDLAFEKRPDEELYDLSSDPDQLVNVASDPAYLDVKMALSDALMAQLRATGDPRVTGAAVDFDAFPYLGGGPKHPSWKAR
jgi:arylsulfatase A-like enzyme